MITFDDVSVAFGVTTVVRDVSMRVERGRILAIVGPSGCGKSTLLSTVNRLVDLEPSARVTGRVCVDDRDVRDPAWPPADLRCRVGMVFQAPNPFPTSIRRNVELAPREHGVRDRARLDALVEQALRDVGLWDEVADRLDESATRLSGGQQQRLCLARALALSPDVVLLDEPCSALDPLAAGLVEDLIVGLAGRHTLVVVTHDLAQARRIADDVAVFGMVDGCGALLEHGPAAALFERAHDPAARAYLEGRRP